MQRWEPEQVYEKVGDEESSDGLPVGQAKRRTVMGFTIRSLVSGVILVVLGAVATYGLIWWPARVQAAQRAADHHENHYHQTLDLTGYYPENWNVPNPDLHKPKKDEEAKKDEVANCGTTIEEAKALGCTWDLLAAAWLPPACIDQELTDEFRAQGPWTYWADREGTQELFEPELQNRVGEGLDYYTSLRYHRTHCSYQWRKMHRAMQRGTKIENKLADFHHTVHCGFVSMQEGDMEDLLTRITVELMSC